MLSNLAGRWGFRLIVAGALVASFSISALAVPTGWSVSYIGKTKGEVVFSGADHEVKGLVCLDCHLDPFNIAKHDPARAIPMSDHVAGRFCGKCHDGTRAFSVADELACRKCHTKAPVGAFPQAAGK